MATLVQIAFRWRPVLIAVALFWLPTLLLAQEATISGRILRLDSLPAYHVPVYVTGTVNTIVLTDQSGYYSVKLPVGGVYTIRPFTNVDPLNGVTSFDGLLISRHYSGAELLDSPYKIIAADVDGSGVIDTQDIIQLRRVFLGIDFVFPVTGSYRFIRTNYVFPDPANPFPFPETFNTANLSTDITGIDFISIKTGDVNFSAQPEDDYLDPGIVNLIKGIARLDANANCVADAGEQPLINWRVAAVSAKDTFYTQVHTDGSYNLSVLPGNYTVYLLPLNALWQVCQAQGIPVELTIFPGFKDSINFTAQASIDCSELDVDLATDRLRRCFPYTYNVNYCNEGTVAAQNASVEVTLDSFLTVTQTNPAWVTKNGNTYTFQIGNLEVLECGQIKIEGEVSCNAVLGQTHCSSARIFPDTSCLPPNIQWNGASLRVEASCQGDKATFTITNTGADMASATNYVVIEDIMVQMTGTIQLKAGESEVISLPANGSTWRFEVDQPLFHPYTRRASASLEGCGLNGSGSFSTGFVTLFPTDEARNSEATDCQENIGSFDPNDKHGYPLGIGEQHFVPRDQRMEYKIRFQNTGTDTAFTVIIRDTLSDLLDINSLRMGAASHNYTYNLYGKNILQIIFQHIMLPDSNINEPGSHGFVQFSILPKANLPVETSIYNRAGIYFDFNEPVITNTTDHTFGENYLTAAAVPLRAGFELEVFPNPASEEAIFLIRSARPHDSRLFLFETTGRMIQNVSFTGNLYQLNIRDLAPGVYFYRLDSEGGPAAAGKLIISK